MTNFKKSFGVLAVGLLALTFCCVLIAQSAMAREEGRVTHATPYYEQGTVPLPGSDDIAVEAKAPKKEAHHVEQPVSLDAADVVDVPSVRTRPEVVTSVMQGGDTYGTATVITGPGSYSGTTVGYTHDYDATLCGSANTCPDVVYSYTPTANAFMDLSLCNSGGTDTKLWVLDGTFTEIQCNDDGDDCPGYESHITSFPIAAGTTYYIVIGGWGDSDAGPYVLDVTEYVEGVDCEAPFQIEFDPGDGEDDDSQDYVVDLSGGGPNSTIGAPNCLFYEFTAEATGFYSFSWTADENVPLAFLTGIGGAIQCPSAYALDYGGTAGPWIVQAVMLPGWTYIMEPFDWGEGQTGVITISRQEMQALNDECADAEDLGVGDGYHFVHNVNATLSPGFDYTFCDPTQLPYSQTCGDVWYTWTADVTGYVNFDMCLYGDSWDSKMFLYRGYDCSGATPIDPFGCSDDGCGAFGDGGFIEVECTAGETFMFRIAGWISGENEENSSCATEGGMGTGHIDIYQHATSWRPANDDCPDAVVGTLAPGGDVYTTTGSLDLASWGSCPDLYNTVDGSIGIGGVFAWMVFDAFSISECTDIRVDFCGTSDVEGGGYVNFTNWPQGVNLFTGCPCEGPFVTVPTSGGTYTGVCDPLVYTDPDFNFSRGWDYLGLLPGVYYHSTSCWEMGRTSSGGTYNRTDPYTVNFRGTPVACEYCAATSNINSCPPVAGASWIDGVTFEAISTSGSGCNAYEDNSALVASLYKGLDYELSVVMGKVGIAGEHDSCDAWIDWNQNSGFAAFVPEINEKIELDRLALTWTGTVSVPMDAAEPGEGATGVTAMRVRMASDADGANVPCGEKVWGEVEDFTVEVTTLECGDFDIDGTIDADDIAFIRDWYFGGGTAPDFWQRADIDGDGVITIADVIGLVDAAYHGGATVCL